MKLTQDNRDEARIAEAAMAVLTLCSMYSEASATAAAEYIEKECGSAGVAMANLMRNVISGELDTM